MYFRRPLHSPSSYPDLGWELTPGAKKTEPNIEKEPILYCINYSGFRDKSNDSWKKWDSRDIKLAFIGDSITYGTGVNYKDTYSSVAESLLSEAAKNVRIINAGILGTNTLQHSSILKYKLIPYNPDIVILGYFLNDTERRCTQKLPKIFRYILRYFNFGTFLISRIATAIETRMIPAPRNGAEVKKDRTVNRIYHNYTRSVIDSYETAVWQENKKIIKSMSELCRSKSIEFGVVCFPFEEQIKGICSDRPQKKISDFCLANNIPFLDILEIYKKRIHEKLYLERDNGHPNSLGHYIAAEAISKWLLTGNKFKGIFRR